ncbi:MAG: hypothetical protein B6U94_03370 [Thermofilum sp. ex4484_79]|nr:MAG: hypothetical protein B6U94_03370 [Thermofilum sp. ex4484_79]
MDMRYLHRYTHMAKKHISLYIDEKVIKESKQIGLNISRVCENVLREAVERLKGNADKHLFANINVECWARGLVASHGGGPGFDSRRAHYS